MNVFLIIRLVLKLCFTQILHPGSSRQIAIAPHSSCSSCVSFDIILKSNAYNTRLEQGISDISRANEFSSDLLLDSYSHQVHQNKSMECRDLETRE